MRVPGITQIITSTSRATFIRYHDGKLWYSIPWDDAGVPREFEFLIPIEDTGTGVFPHDEKSLFFMRWARKHIALLNEALAQEAGG